MFQSLNDQEFFCFFILEEWPPEFCPHFLHECYTENPCCKGKLNDIWRINARSRIFFLFPSKEIISSIGEKDQIQNKILWFWRRWEVLKPHLSVEKGCWSRTGKERSRLPRGWTKTKTKKMAKKVDKDAGQW